VSGASHCTQQPPLSPATHHPSPRQRQEGEFAFARLQELLDAHILPPLRLAAAAPVGSAAGGKHSKKTT
jgi:hypothetical protein